MLSVYHHSGSIRYLANLQLLCFVTVDMIRPLYTVDWTHRMQSPWVRDRVIKSLASAMHQWPAVLAYGSSDEALWSVWCVYKGAQCYWWWFAQRATWSSVAVAWLCCTGTETFYCVRSIFNIERDQRRPPAVLYNSWLIRWRAVHGRLYKARTVDFSLWYQVFATLYCPYTAH